MEHRLLLEPLPDNLLRRLIPQNHCVEDCNYLLDYSEEQKTIAFCLEAVSFMVHGSLRQLNGCFAPSWRTFFQSSRVWDLIIPGRVIFF